MLRHCPALTVICAQTPIGRLASLADRGLEHRRDLEVVRRLGGVKPDDAVSAVYEARSPPTPLFPANWSLVAHPATEPHADTLPPWMAFTKAGSDAHLYSLV